ncbi:D-alanyl-D-alanine carboxypeptidase [Streptomyces sp. NBC_00841]|uniref:D-alanyl-D-alanine carboxypeptidase n=1 Tax=Streptomyces sp. NBC_00841 TaxID=2975847 RepID=UPI002DD8335E|nr:D-alanyl-D-alanine carboxypeptidase [Streptomyces sp. NBC_00841]WSA00134.1 D-alanyl-D-alanine carboxypeptidase [Streptomyces sp. NBC_00841]
MAGESPDKSEQQKSSGTARSEGDPRLAAFREPASPAESGGKKDTATAVFRTKPVENGEDAEHAEGVDGTENASEGPEAASTPSGPAEPEEGDARLRAAVAAWVGKGDDDAAGAAAEEPEAADDADDAAKPETVAESDTSAPAEEAGESGTDSADATADEAAASSADAADAAEVADDAAETDADTHHDADDEAADKPAASGDAAAAAADEDAAATTDADEDEDEPAVSGDASDETRVSEGREESHAADAADAADSEGDKSAGDSEPAAADDADDDAGDDAAKGADADVVDPAKDAGDAGDGEPAAADDADDDADDGAAEGAEATGADTGDTDGTEPTADKRGIDQPTAVFKAIRRDRIDQPTTALKITRPSAKPEEKPEPESPAERTSQFVPLRRDDARPAPAPRKPETTGSAAAQAARPSPASAPAPSLSGAERTRQQPLPPRPPLDLLAELTNTPPPPETPVRTAVRRVKIWTPLVLLLLVVFAIVQVVRPLPAPELQLTAKPTYTFEGGKPSLPWPSEGQGYMAATGLGTVDSFGEQKAVPIGSVAKAMTAYVVLKDHPLKKGKAGPSITVDAKAESDGKLDSAGESTLNTVKAGDKLTEQQALSAIMIPSANNIARLLARWDAGSEQAFVKKMNDTAKSLGMKNTTYTDPSGLKETTVSSAEDQVKLGQKLVEIPALMAITQLPSWTDPSGKNWRNYNTLVPYNGALGIKTGSTTKAGGNLLFAAHKMVGDTDQLIVGAVLGQHKAPIIDTVNAVSKEVMVATKDLLESGKVVKKGDVVGRVDDGLGGTVPVIATEDVAAVGWPGLTVRIELTDDGRTIPHSAAAGTHVGTLTVGEGASQVKVAVALQSDLAEPGFGQKLTRIS